jgi:hypothetical protein
MGEVDLVAVRKQHERYVWPDKSDSCLQCVKWVEDDPDSHMADWPCDAIKLATELQDIRDGNRIILDEKCASDEVHCGCVPVLRREIGRLREALEKIVAIGQPDCGGRPRGIARAALHTKED